jgi:hypothetical protein
MLLLPVGLLLLAWGIRMVVRESDGADRFAVPADPSP